MYLVNLFSLFFFPSWESNSEKKRVSFFFSFGYPVFKETEHHYRYFAFWLNLWTKRGKSFLAILSKIVEWANPYHQSVKLFFMLMSTRKHLGLVLIPEMKLAREKLFSLVYMNLWLDSSLVNGEEIVQNKVRFCLSRPKEYVSWIHS